MLAETVKNSKALDESNWRRKHQAKAKKYDDTNRGHALE